MEQYTLRYYSLVLCLYPVSRDRNSSCIKEPHWPPEAQPVVPFIHH